MATKKVTFDNKVAIIPPGNRINQVWDQDINELKDAINKNADVQIENTQTLENIVNEVINGVTYSEDFIYLGGPQEFTITTPNINVKSVFRGRVRLFNDEYTFVGNVVTITYDTLDIDEKISITN